MKLGIKIVFTSGGVQDGYTFNNNEILSKNAIDIRRALSSVFPTKEQLRAKGLDPMKSLDGSSKVVYLVTLLGRKGYLITAIKVAPDMTGRTYDNTAAWVYFPADIDITGMETANVLEELVRIISDPRSIDENRLRNIAAIDYPQSRGVKNIPVSQGSSYGVIEYGSGCRYDFPELLGNFLMQPAYAQFKGIFLVNKQDNLALTSPSLVINNSLKPLVTIPNPPVTGGFTPYVNGQPFNHPVQVCSGEDVEIVWKRSNYADITKYVNTSRPVNMQTVLPQRGDVKVLIRRDMFKAVDSDGRPVSNFQIRLNSDLFSGETISLREETVRSGVRVTVGKNGYGSATATVTDFSRPLTFKLSQSILNYNFTITAYDEDGKPLKEKIQANLKTTHKLVQSPIKGYDTENDRLYSGDTSANRMYYQGTSKLPWLLAFLCGAAVVLLIWGALAFFGNDKSEKGEAQDTENTEAVQSPGAEGDEKAQEQKIQAQDADMLKAVEYLNKPKWKLDEMESNKYLKGLYDALDNFEYDRILDVYAPRFNQRSTTFDNLVSAVQEAKAAGRTFETKRPYVKDNSGTITIDGYLKFLRTDPNVGSQQESAEPQRHLNTSKKNPQQSSKVSTGADTDKGSKKKANKDPKPKATKNNDVIDNL